jgi:uncharacterized protein (DUF2132 family)
MDPGLRLCILTIIFIVCQVIDNYGWLESLPYIITQVIKSFIATCSLVSSLMYILCVGYVMLRVSDHYTIRHFRSHMAANPHVF